MAMLIKTQEPKHGRDLERKRYAQRSVRLQVEMEVFPL